MYVTSQMVFWLLSKKQDLTYWEFSDQNKKVRTPRIFRGQELQPESLYILDELMDFNSVTNVEHCAFLILSGTQCMLPDVFRRADVAFVKPGVSRLDLFDEVNSIFSLLLDLDAQFKDACYNGGNTVKLLNMMEAFMGVPITLYDGWRNEQITVGDVGGRAAFSEVYELFLDNDYKKLLKEKCAYEYPQGPGEKKNLYRNIFYKEKPVAVLGAGVQREHMYEGEKILFWRLSEYVMIAYLNETNCIFLGVKHNKIHRAIGSILFNDSAQITQETRSLLADFDWRDEHRYHVVVLETISKSDTGLSASYLHNKLESDWPDTCLLTMDSGFVWVVNDTKLDPGRSLHDYFSRFIQEHMLKAGISECREGLGSLNTLYKQAGASLAIGQRKHPHIWKFAFEDYLLDYILNKLYCDFPVGETIHRGLLRLIDYDRENATDYVDTLQCYIKNQFNASVSAEALYVHRSTLLRRIERMAEIAGINLQRPDELLHIMLSLKLCDHLGYIHESNIPLNQ